MRLLVCTQKVNMNDPILGFFHRWLVEFAKKYEKVTVICLEEGHHNLPENVSVFSLGKEKRKSRIQYLFRFFKYIWKERNNYDSVFVHMNQEYVVLGWKIWKLLGKKIYLWRNHKKGNFLTRFSVMVSNRVFCVSSDSFTARFKKTELMPAGIDTDNFKRDVTVTPEKKSVLCLGRISQVKNVHVLAEAVVTLAKADSDFKVDFVGDATPDSKSYYEGIRKRIIDLEALHIVRFLPAVSPDKTGKIYNEHELYVNMTDTGSFDKTILEAMATEGLVVISNVSFKKYIPEKFHEYIFFKQNDSGDLAEKIKKILALPEDRKEKTRKTLRNVVLEYHSLKLLVEKLAH